MVHRILLSKLETLMKYDTLPAVVPPLEEGKKILAAHAGRRLLIGNPPRRSTDHELGILPNRLRNTSVAAAAAVAVSDVEQRRLRLRKLEFEFKSHSANHSRRSTTNFKARSDDSQGIQ